jgi:hypothetical protein
MESGVALLAVMTLFAPTKITASRCCPTRTDAIVEV